MLKHMLYCARLLPNFGLKNIGKDRPMKKMFALLMALGLVVAAGACGGGGGVQVEIEPEAGDEAAESAEGAEG
jgi:hypothetical protein